MKPLKHERGMTEAELDERYVVLLLPGLRAREHHHKVWQDMSDEEMREVAAGIGRTMRADPTKRFEIFTEECLKREVPAYPYEWLDPFEHQRTDGWGL